MADLKKRMFEEEKNLVLIFGDVDRVKSYVFETSRLPEIRGASEILNELNTEVLEKIFTSSFLEDYLIYNGGGSFLALVPQDNADDIMRKIERAYIDRTKVATITCVKSEPMKYTEFTNGLWPYNIKDWLKFEGKGVGKWIFNSHFGKNKEEWLKRKNFGEHILFLSSRLRREKESKELYPFQQALPIMRRCQSCGVRGVVNKIIINGDELWICEICQIKRNSGQKSRFIDGFKLWLKEKKNIITQASFPKDLNDLTIPFGNYMAFIYADGNDIGALLETASKIEDYKLISEKLSEGVRCATFEALFDTFGERLNKFETFPFEIVNIGGDDITIIIAAPFAFKFATSFLEWFEKNMEDLSSLVKGIDKKVTSSLGMVIAKDNYPIYYCEKLASDLLKEAKSKSKSNGGESTISYLYLTTSIAAESSKTLIDDIYKSNKYYSLTLRPYTLSQLKFLMEIAPNVKNLFPGVQREAIAEALSKGVYQLLNFLLYQIGRMSKEEKKQAALEVLNKISSQFGCNSLLGWTKDEEGRYATPLMDILEIIKVVGCEIDG